MKPQPHQLAAAGLAALGASSAIPIPLVQLDFAGLINVFDIDSGDAPNGLLIVVATSGFLTIGVVVAAFIGVALTVLGAPSARPVLVTAALAGLVTALAVWLPAAIVIGAAAVLLGREAAPSSRAPVSEVHLPR